MYFVFKSPDSYICPAKLKADTSHQIKGCTGIVGRICKPGTYGWIGLCVIAADRDCQRHFSSWNLYAELQKLQPALGLITRAYS
jgi:hypothetical protein